jgi:site-specific DNA-methyltransferase (adenine-specific)/adenine-specific DNA-methyltransferase
LRDDGAIFVSIDDNEVAALRLMMDEIFGTANFITQFVWEKRKNRENRKVISMRHDHVICYGRNSVLATKSFRRLPMNEEALARYKNPDDDPRGPWKSDPATAQAGHGTKSQFYVLVAPSGKRHELPSGRCWVYTEPVMKQMMDDDRIWFGAKGTNVPRIKTYLHEKERSLTPESILFAKDASTNEEAKNSLKDIFGGHAPFETPKPMELIAQFISISAGKSDIILDSFAGSGSMAHAVLKLNAEDGGTRRFVLIEMDENIASQVTAERVKRVAAGYTNGKGLDIEGAGGGFQFCRLSADPLFDAAGQIRSDVSFAQLAEFVWFAETGAGLTQLQGGKVDSPLLGVHEGRAIYLLYNGILKDKSIAGGNVLTGPVFDQLPKFDGPKVIYAAANRMGGRASRENITFKQTPYALEV